MKPSRSICWAYLLYHIFLYHSYFLTPISIHIFFIFVRHDLGEQGHCLLWSLDQGRRTILHWRQMHTDRITRDSVSHRLPYAVALQQNWRLNPTYSNFLFMFFFFYFVCHWQLVKVKCNCNSTVIWTSNILEGVAANSRLGQNIGHCNMIQIWCKLRNYTHSHSTINILLRN